MKDKLTLCIDIGGTHIAVASVQKINEKIVPIAEANGEVDSTADRASILNQWEQTINQVWDSNLHKIDTVLFSMPGPFDYKNGICLMDGMHKYQALLNMDVKSYFAEQYDVVPDRIQFLNDAEAFLLGEIHHHGLQKKRVAGISVGTGLGSAFYNGTKVKDLNYGSAPFREGIAEDYMSTRGILSFLKKKGVDGIPNVKALVEVDGLEQQSEIAFSFLSAALLEFIEIYILPLKPDTIIVGGNIAKAYHRFLPFIQKKIHIPIREASFNEWNLFFGLASSINV
jgi:glucokinase